MKKLSILYKSIFFAAGLILSFLAIVSITIQTQWGQKKIISYVIKMAKTQGIELSVKEIKGTPPFEYEMSGIDVKISNDDRIEIDSVKFRIALLPLIKKQLTFSYFNADNITYNFSSSNNNNNDAIYKVDWPNPALSFSFRDFNIKNLHMKVFNEPWDINIKGKAKIKRKGKRIYAKVNFTRKNFEETSCTLDFLAIKKTNIVKADVNISTTSLSAFYPICPKDNKTKGTIDLKTQGNWDSYWKLLSKTYDKKDNYDFIKVFANGIITDENLFFVKDLEFYIRSNLYENYSMNVSNITFENKYLQAHGKASLSDNLSLEHADINIKSHDLSIIDFLRGSFVSKFQLQRENNKINIKSDFNFKDLHINNQPILDFSGNIESYYLDKHLDGIFSFKMKAIDQIFNGKSDFEWTKNQSLSLPEISIKGFTSSIEGNLSFTPEKMILGSIAVHSDTLSELRVFFKDLDLYSQLDMEIELDQKLENEKPVQYSDIKTILTNFHYNELFIDSSNVEFTLKNTFQSPKGYLSIKSENIKYNKLFLNNFSFTSSNIEDNWPYEISANGQWKEPCDFLTHGFWRYKDNEITVNIQEFSGHMLGYPFFNPTPIQLEKKKDYFILQDAQITMPKSSFNANVKLDQKNADINLSLNHFPLDFLSFNPLELAISGFTTLEASLTSKNNETNSTINLNLENMQIYALGDEKPLKVNGNFNAVIEKDKLHTEGQLKIREKQLMQMKSLIPLDINLYPFKIGISPKIPLSSEITYSGQIEEVLDFFNMGVNRIEGTLNCKLNVSDTLENLQVDGFGNFENGLYENYYTGTYLKDIKAQINAKNHELTINSFSASDGKDGIITGKGNINLSRQKNFIYEFDTEFKNVACFQSELVTAIADGNISVHGNIKNAYAEGNIFMPKVKITIPEKLPTTIPYLPVTYINKPQKSKELMKPIEKPYKINLDIGIETSDDVSITGRGLTSKWKGGLKLLGTYSNLLPKGQFDLLEGNFSFAGKDFKLSKGSVIFTGKEDDMPQLHITAETGQKGVTILANLSGPINAPEIQFTSNPPLPLSAIMSYLLFGQDISDISGFQAMQLATTVASVTSGPTALESSQKSLGIDRLAVVKTTSRDNEEPDQKAVQVGKYVTKGVLVSLSQGMEQGSSNVIVEVDLTNGFVFQAETQQQKEQGKFTIKWSHNF